MTPKDHIDCWAACRRHLLEGGTGYPTLDAVMDRVDPPEASTRRAEESDTTYEASKDKYERSASKWRLPDGSFSKFILIEEVLRDMFLTQDERGETLGALPFFTEYLLLVYPENEGAYSLSVTESEQAVDSWLKRQFPNSTFTERKGYLKALEKTTSRLIRAVSSRLRQQ